MNKFNKIKDKELQVGAGLLSPISRAANVDSYEIVNVDMDMIVPNKKNEFTIGEIEELAELILMSGGILQPLILIPEKNTDGTYTLTTGERRWRAARLLKEQGRYPEKYKNTVPCIFRNPSDIQMQVSDETKELFSIMVTNQYRQKKEADQLMEVRNWTRIFRELKENGAEYIPEQLAVLAGRARYAQDGSYEPEKLTGEKMKKLVASHAKISEGKVQQIHKVDKNAGEDLLDKLLKNEVSFSAAEKMIEMPEQEQKRLLEENTGVRIEKEQVEQRLEVIEKKIRLSREQIISEIQKITEQCPSHIELGTKEYKRYLSCISQLERILL